MALRESKRHRDKRPFMPFGDMMLPVIGFVAVGLLVAGIKLFFLSGPKPRAYEAVAVAEQKNSVALSPTQAFRNEKPERETSPSLPGSLSSATPVEKKNLILAVPAAGNTRGESDSAVNVEDKKKESIAKAKDAKTTSGKKIAPTKPLPEVKKKTPEVKEPRKTSQNAASNTTEDVTSFSSWGIQVGSFTEKNVADSVMAKLKKKGYSVTVSSAVVHEKKYYRVSVIEGKDRSKAEARAQVLTREGYPVLVVPVK
ncbi:MAG: SPOR domain-containing protein [Smithella sp.]